ncbi:Phenylacetic acid degradation-related protein [Rhodopseudomonas palustris BisB5]|uniref:Phenylacetic acid degradation-related protein n=1 Tax=Rhodopseudomonas palustris (strain BisB5) TaxID=316057 RepID=Q13C22_RHOPS|nr:Phenylacetic acid degradation-related protein [Rhodopseudomonas palustris BisB5]
MAGIACYKMGIMPDTSSEPRAISFDEKARMLQLRRSIHGAIIGLKLDRFAPAQAWSSLPYHPVFVGDTRTGVIHGGVVTAMLDESCGMAVQLALPDTPAIATLDLRIDYLRPATPGQAIRAHAHCYHLTRSIAFVRATAYQDSEADPIASATAMFMIGANHTDMLRQTPKVHFDTPPPLVAPEDPDGPLGISPYPRFLGIRVNADAQPVMPYDPKLVGNPILPALHGGVIGAFLETAAIVSVHREIGLATAPKPIGLTVNYLRSGRPLDTYAKVSIVKQGRRVVAFEAQAYQADPAKPIASCYGHFKLRAAPSRDGTRA